MSTYHSIKNIKKWALEDQPREKLIAKGREYLTNAELIAILIGSGNKEESAVSLAKRILQKVDNNLHDLGKLEITDFQKFKGIGTAKSISICAALELGRRRNTTKKGTSVNITSSNDAYQVLRIRYEDQKYEQFWVLLLNRANQIIACKQISTGGVSSTVVDTKKIIKLGVDLLATGIILSHNHPSGNLKPSQADTLLTEKVKSAAKLFDINVLDHLIITDSSYFSFNDEGIL